MATKEDLEHQRAARLRRRRPSKPGPNNPPDRIGRFWRRHIVEHADVFNDLPEVDWRSDRVGYIRLWRIVSRAWKSGYAARVRDEKKIRKAGK